MLLEEIVSKKAPQNFSRDRINYQMGVLGRSLKQLGSGHQSTAFGHINKPNMVVKTIQLKDNDPVIPFLEICLANKTNPFLPRIYTIKEYKRERDRYLIITMERLKMLRGPGNPFNGFDLFYALRILPSPRDKQHPLYVRIQQSNWNFGELTDALYDMFSEPYLRQWLVKNTPNKQLAQVITQLDHLFDEFYADLHLDNFAIRDTGSTPQLVLFDPVMG